MDSVLICNVLGSTEVEADGAGVGLGGPTPRRLFTALVAARGGPVPDDRLAEAVWGGRPPKEVSATLQVHVSRLRQALGERHRGALVRTGSGYALRLSEDATDVARFVRDVGQGRRLLAEDRAEQAATILSRALASWRGEPFTDLAAADVAASDPARAARITLAELREVAIDERCAAWLAMGESDRTVAELGAGVNQDPYREGRWALLIVGLYRCGRPGDALAALRRVRALLADELGVDPGPELQDLERRVLIQDPHLLAGSSAPGVGGAARRAPDGASFLGREHEMATLRSAVAGQRLVTLVGPAGVGKTRLVMEHLHATDLGATAREDGPWLVRLADVSRPEFLAGALARALGLTEVSGDPRAAAATALATRSGLLVLDNCEHLVEPVADLVVDLLVSCPGLRILATSREPLGVDGETVLPVEPLAARLADGEDGPAVALLLDRVRAIRPGWAPSAEECASAAQISESLDGLPLALELAAARARTLSLAEIAGHLDDRFALLGTVPRGPVTAHATLHAAIEWSVAQLPDLDRSLLYRLWPFESGFSLEAADAVRPTDTSMIESLSTLVARSVVIADTTMTPTRYRLLETVRAYCRDHDPDPAATREAHARWCRDLVERYVDELTSPRGGHVVRMLGRELPNLRAAITFDLEHRPEAALRTVGRIDRFWINGGYHEDGRRLLDAALLAAPHAPTLDRGRAVLARASLSALTEDVEEARRRFAEAFTLATVSDDRDHRMLLGWVLFRAALGLIIVQSAEPAAAAAEQAVAVGEELGDDWLIASGRTMLGATQVLRGHPVDGQATLAAAAELAERHGMLWTAGCARLFLGWAIMRRAPGSTDPTHLGVEALAALRRALDWFQRLDDVTFGLTVLDTGATALAVAGHPARAARLRAAVRHHAARRGVAEAYLRRLGAMMRELPVTETLDAAEAEAAGRRLSWARMGELLTITPD